MRKKDLIYFTSAAILMAVSAQSAQADEQTATDLTAVEQHAQTSNEGATSPYLAGPVKVETDVSTNQVVASVTSDTPKNDNEQATASKTDVSTESKEVSLKETLASSESQAPLAQVDSQSVSQEAKPNTTDVKADKQSVSEGIQANSETSKTETSNEVKPSTEGTTSFLNTGSTGPRNASSNVSVQPKAFIDVSSHNGYLSVEDYRILANKGVGGVVVKLTEATTYTNPYAEGQIRNAQSAGLQVSAYAYSHYTSEAEARAEARYFVSVAKRFNLSTNTVMVNDIEEPSMQANINRNTLAWADEMRRQGYTNLMYYTSASWLSGSNPQYRGPINAPQFGVQNFWVAQYPAPKLTTTDAKQLRYNGNTGAWQFTSQADLLSGKHVFDLSVDYTGRFTANAKPAPLPPVKGKIAIQNSNPTTGDFDVIISEVSAPYGVKTVSVPIWPEGAKQSEVIWYTANPQSNGTYSLHVKASDHKNKAGKYNVHLYYVQQNDEQIGAGGTTTQVIIGKTAEEVKPKGKITIQNSNPTTGDFDVLISEVSSPYGVKSVSVPIWSEKDNKNVIWYPAKRQTDGTYLVNVKASSHKNQTGKYNVHLYYTQSDDQLVGVGGTTTDVVIGKSAENLKPSAKLTIENNNTVSGSFDAVIRDIKAPAGLKEVLVPTWTAANGQDDIVWHKAVKQSDGSYKATIKASEHKGETGKYFVHVYFTDNANQRSYVDSTAVDVSIQKDTLFRKPSGILTIENKNAQTGSYDAVIRNVVAPTGLKEVLVPTWSQVNGQDDLVWHKAVRQADGSYRATIKVSEHKNSKGKYFSHLYFVNPENQREFITATATEVSFSRPTGVLSIENNNAQTGSYDAVIRNVVAPTGLKEVLVPTWSQVNGQDDLVWHKAVRQADGSYRATIKASEHKNSTGKYFSHVYFVNGENQREFITATATEVTFTRPTGVLSIENNNAQTGSFDAVIRNVVAPTGLKEVLVPTWSDVNGQDDIIWHKAVRQTDGSYRATIKASEHKGNVGRYNVHVYFVNGENQKDFVAATAIQVASEKPVGTISVVNNNQDKGTFDVVISDIYSPKGVRTVQVPIWADKASNADVRWYEATRQSNGTYKLSVKASDHKFATGLYHIHLYYIQTDGSQVGVGGTTTKVDFKELNTQTQALITNVNGNAGTWTVTVTEAPQGRTIKNIRVAAWYAPNTGTVNWYNTAPTGKRTDVTLSTLNHGNAKGEYTTHVYVDYTDGSVQGFNLGNTTLTPQNQRVNPQSAYYSQRNPQWAGKWYGRGNIDQSGCVPTVLAMVISDLKDASVKPDTLADYLYYQTNSFNKLAFGTSTEGIIAVADKWGLKTGVLASAQAIKNTLATGKHVLAAVGASQFVSAPLTHEILLQGYDNGKTYVRDPFNQANNGWYSVDYLFGIQSLDPIDRQFGSPFISISL